MRKVFFLLLANAPGLLWAHSVRPILFSYASPVFNAQAGPALNALTPPLASLPLLPVAASRSMQAVQPSARAQTPIIETAGTFAGEKDRGSDASPQLFDGRRAPGNGSDGTVVEAEEPAAPKLSRRRSSIERAIKKETAIAARRNAELEVTRRAINEFLEGLKRSRAAGESIGAREAAKKQTRLEERLETRRKEAAADDARERLYLLKEGLRLTDRRILREQAGAAAESAGPLLLDMRMPRSLDAKAAYEWMARAIKDRGFGQEQVLVRFVSPYREDLVRLAGSDRAGLDETDQRETNFDRQWGYDQELRKRGLRLEDGLYLGGFEDIPDSFRRYFKDFARGRLKLVFYRADAFDFIGGDFAVFRDPRRKRSSVLGVAKLAD